MCEVTDYLCSFWMAAPLARKSVKTIIIGGLTLRSQLRAFYCLLY